jgi:hypothetical protein
LKTKQQVYWWSIHEEMDIFELHFLLVVVESTSDDCELARIADTECRHEVLGFFADLYGWSDAAHQFTAMAKKIYWQTFQKNTPGLYWLDEMLRILCDKTEAGLMCMEFDDTTERLLGDHG